MPYARSALTLFAALVSAVARAQDPGPIDTDRPDQTESSALVPARHVQLEFGLAYTDDGPASETLESPALLVRYGVIDRLELRLGVPTLTTEFIGGTDTGLSDPELGAKIALWKEKGWLPEAALLVHTSVPVGSSHFSSHRFDPSFRFSFGHTLPRGFSLGYNLGAAWETSLDAAGNGRDTLSRFEYTAALGHDFSERWGAYVEGFGDTPLSDSADSAHSLDAGVTYLIRNNLQLDFAAGLGLNSKAPDAFVSAGLSVRFPK